MGYSARLRSPTLPNIGPERVLNQVLGLRRSARWGAAPVAAAITEGVRTSPDMHVAEREIRWGQHLETDGG